MKYLKLKFTEGYIHTEEPHTEVMGDWETPLMRKHAELCCHNGGDILEIGFGMGIFATAAQKIGVKSHTIVESHPQVLERLYEWAQGNPNIIIIEGDWFDMISKINSRQYDGIFFDTHLDPNRKRFRELVVDYSLKDCGIFTYFNIGLVDTFNYQDKLIVDSIQIETPDDSRLRKGINEFYIPYFKLDFESVIPEAQPSLVVG